MEDPGLVNLMVLHGEVDLLASDYNPITQRTNRRIGPHLSGLGHIHQASGLRKSWDELLWLARRTMGRGFDEAGPKGRYVVTLDRGGARRTLFPLVARRYEATYRRGGR